MTKEVTMKKFLAVCIALAMSVTAAAQTADVTVSLSFPITPSGAALDQMLCSVGVQTMIEGRLAHKALSRINSARLRAIPLLYPPSVPSLRMTRWHGIRMGTGLAAQARATARTALGRPIAWAILL
jgi:hypothetical protein